MKKNITLYKCLLMIVITSFTYTNYAQGSFEREDLLNSVTTTSNLNIWNRIEVIANLNAALLESDQSTFKNNRLDVIFTHTASGETLHVPCYFAADRDAANSHSNTGVKFKTIFRPNITGSWTYQVLFYRANNVVFNLNLNRFTTT